MFEGVKINVFCGSVVDGGTLSERSIVGGKFESDSFVVS